MRIAADGLESHLEEATLAPVYLLSGDEPLQIEEAADSIRRAAHRHGYTERHRLHVEAGFDWGVLVAEASNRSLFAARRLIELRMPSGRPGREGAEMLRGYASQPAAEVLLLVITARLDAVTLKSEWCRALERSGVLVRVWPVDAGALPHWIERRMHRLGLRPDREACAVLAERVQGNLLAARQEIEKLLLVHGPGPVSAPVVATAVADNARFDPFELLEAALHGDLVRTVRIASGLRSEGIAPMQVLGLLGFELRRLSRLSTELRGGAALDELFARYRIWGRHRQDAVRRALGRHEAVTWRRLLGSCAEIDRAIKGLGMADPWDMIEDVCLRIAGWDADRRPWRRGHAGWGSFGAVPGWP